MPSMKRRLAPLCQSLLVGVPLAATLPGGSIVVAILGISWFWFLGAMVMAQLPNYVKLLVRGDESVYIFFLSLFTISIAIGSMLTNRLTRSTVELGMVQTGTASVRVEAIEPWQTRRR